MAQFLLIAAELNSNRLSGSQIVVYSRNIYQANKAHWSR